MAAVEPVWEVSVRALDVVVRVLVRLRIVGLEHIPRTGPAVLVANHVSWLDPVVLLVVGHRAGRKVRFLAVEEAFTRPLTGWFFRAGRHIPVSPAGSGRLAALRSARGALTEGEAVLLYPEGTVAAGEAEVDAKLGAGFLATSTSAPVIPMGTAGLERDRHRGRRRAVVVIGRPLDVNTGAAAEGGAPRRRRSELQHASETIVGALRDCVAIATRERSRAGR